MVNYKKEINKLILKEARRRLLEESLSRLVKCLDELSEEEVWWRPNQHSNSVGNLVLHLCGNVRQWMLSGLGGQPDNRVRQAEFDTKGPLPTKELKEKLNRVMAEVEVLMDNLDPDLLIKPIKVQGFEENGIAILIHVIEHFSYHVGQVAYITKAAKDIDLKFYGDQNLDVTG